MKLIWERKGYFGVIGVENLPDALILKEDNQYTIQVNDLFIFIYHNCNGSSLSLKSPPLFKFRKFINKDTEKHFKELNHFE